MIVLTFKAKAFPEDIRELIHSLKSMLEHVRKLEGCLDCICYQSVEDANEVCFVEHWFSKAALEEHLKSDLYGAIQGAFKVLTEDGATIEQTEVTYSS